MTRDRLRTWPVLLVVLLIATACAQPPAPPGTPFPSVPSPPPAMDRLTTSPSAMPATPISTATLSPVPTEPPEPTATASARPSQTPAPTPTITHTPTPSPTVTPYVLACAAPTTEELLPLLANYVIAHGLTAEPYLWSIGWLADYAAYDADYTRQVRDLDGDGQAEILLWAPQAYQDANAFLAVFVRTAGRWQVGTFVWDEYGHYDSLVYPEITRLGTAQIVVDLLAISGGTGLLTRTWTRVLIRCAGSECGEVWHGTMAELDSYAGCPSGSTWQLVHLALSGDCLVEESGGLRIATVDEVFCLERGDRPSVTVRPRTRATYCWDGSRYARSGLEQLAPGYVVQEIVDGLACQSTYPLLRVDRFPDGQCGHSAQEVDAFWGHPGLPPVAAAVYGQPGAPDEWIAGVFDPGDTSGCPVRLISATQAAQVATVDCTPSFTAVRWLDLNGGGPELLIDTLARWGSHTLYVLSWDMGAVRQIAKIEGDITSPNLRAVRQVDLDGDGIYEILADALPDDLRPFFGPEPASPMPYRVFRWSGTEYEEEK